MLIGKDFDKIEWEIFGYKLLEPNVFIGDTLLFILTIYLAVRIRKMSNGQPFYTNWFWFFVIFGTAAFVGGLGHLFWNYWDVQGKYFSWYSSILAVYMVEQAMISIHHNLDTKELLKKISQGKMFLSLSLLTYVVTSVDVTGDVTRGLAVPFINSAVGMILSLGVLTAYYQRTQAKLYHFFWIGLIIILPTAIFQGMKINIAQWMDRNDVSHLLLFITFIFYFQGILKVRKLIDA